MKKGRTIQDFTTELDRQATAKRDFIVNTGRMEMTDEAEFFTLRPENGEDINFSMTGPFERQLGAALGIPAKYYDKMKCEHPELLSFNVNAWFDKMQSKHMIRTLDGKARAFLSNRYRRIDN